MKTIILCAGLGSRLNSLEPKGFIKVNKKTIIEMLVVNLLKSGFKKKDIIFATGFKQEMIKKKFGKGFNYVFNKHYKTTNMVFTLFNCLKNIKNEDVLITYSDIVFKDTNIKKMMKLNYKISTLIDFNWKKIWKEKNKLFTDSETLKIKNNKIIELGKPTKNIKKIDGRYVGVLKFSKKIIEDLKFMYFKNLKKNNKKFRKIDMTNYLNYLIHKKISIYPVKLNGNWNEYDDFTDLKYNFKL